MRYSKSALSVLPTIPLSAQCNDVAQQGGPGGVQQAVAAVRLRLHCIQPAVVTREGNSVLMTEMDTNKSKNSQTILDRDQN